MTATENVRLEPGDKAPAFDLARAGGGRVSLDDLRGGPALIYFYPAASTPTCTREACDLRDNHDRFRDAGYRVIGISPDELPAIERFADKQSLPFELLSDPGHEVLAAYGAWGQKNMYGKIKEGVIRSTFAVDADGVLTLARYRVKTPSHIAMLETALGLPEAVQ